MSVMFVGAMCAVGTLNVNAYGFPALIAQMAVFFLAAVWLAVNHVDTRAPDYPLVRIKYGALLLLLPARRRRASACSWTISSTSRPTSSPPAAAACSRSDAKGAGRRPGGAGAACRR